VALRRQFAFRIREEPVDIGLVEQAALAGGGRIQNAAVIVAMRAPAALPLNVTSPQMPHISTDPKNGP